jgi:hypothetical protein
VIEVAWLRHAPAGDVRR